MIELQWNAPVSESKMASQIAALAMTDGQEILDVGCGCGEVLIRICEQHGVQATGIDSSAEHIAEAHKRADGRVTKGAVEFAEADAQNYQVDPGSVDVVMCLGASHAFGLGSKGDRLPFTPRSSANIGFDYNFDWGAYKSFVHANYAYVGGFHRDLAEVTEEVGDYGKLNLRAGISINNWKFELYGTNLSNADDPAGADNLGRIRLTPRQFGLDAGYRF